VASENKKTVLAALFANLAIAAAKTVAGLLGGSAAMLAEAAHSFAYVGPSSLLVAVRLDLRDGLSSQQVEAVSTRIEVELAEVVPEVAQVFLDPTPRELHPAKVEAPKLQKVLRGSWTA